MPAGDVAGARPSPFHTSTATNPTAGRRTSGRCAAGAISTTTARTTRGGDGTGGGRIWCRYRYRMRTEAEIRDRLDKIWLDIGGYMLSIDHANTSTDVMTSGRGLFAAGIISEVLEWVLGGSDPDHEQALQDARTESDWRRMQAQNEREGS